MDFAAFLRELVEDLLETYRLGVVDLIIDTESVYFDVDQSIHCLADQRIGDQCLETRFFGRRRGDAAGGVETSDGWLGGA